MARTVRARRAGGLADKPRPGGPKAGLELTAAEREQLTRWARQPDGKLALRASIVLTCARGRTGKQVAPWICG